MSNKYVVIDLETTGNAPKKGDKIIQFAAVVITNDVVTDEFSSFVNPKQPIPAFIEELTGISDDMVKDAPTFVEIAPRISGLLEDAYFVAHNVLFDLSFLQEELIMAGFEGFYGSVLDTVELARIIQPTSDSYKLTDLAEQNGLRHDRPHQADSDAFVTGELLILYLRYLKGLPIQTIKHLSRLSSGLKSDLVDILAEIVVEKEMTKENLSVDMVLHRGIPIKKIPLQEDVKESNELIYPKSVSEKEMLLKKAFSNYEKRSGQFKMMDLVFDAFTDGYHTLIEAGTGVGKSLAYLLPAVVRAIESEKPVIISTDTTQLQEQLLQKDIPLLRKMIEFPFNTVLLKGKQHYISLEKFAHSLRDRDNHYDTTLAKMQILVWLTITTTGDRDELNLPSGSFQYINKIKYDGHGGDQSKALNDHEYYTRIKSNAKFAQIIITNHSFLLADLLSERQILPDFECLIIDEGHHFEKTAKKLFGKKLDYANVRFFLQQMGLPEQRQLAFKIEKLIDKNEWNREGLIHSFELTQLMSNLFYEMDEMFQIISNLVMKQAKNKSSSWISFRLDSFQSREMNVFTASAERFLFQLKQYIQEMTVYYDTLSSKLDKRNESLQNTVNELGSWLKDGNKIIQSIRDIVLHPRQENVQWIEMDKRAIQNKTTIYSQPTTVAHQLNQTVFQQKNSVVITSATLSVKGSFRFIQNELGLQKMACHQIPSPFSYREQVQLVIPNDLPEINQVSLDEYVYSIGEHIISIAEATKGRMLTLFTSYEMLRKTYELLKESGYLEEYALLAQGISSGSRARLTRNFQRYEKAILLGTNSFWEGIDIPGEDLSCLVIVRLPFSTPDEPLAEAKCEEIKKQGGNPFYDYSLPEAVIRFKQGFGRLIRTKDDKGIMVIFDRRIVTTRYGKSFLDSLPDVKAKEMDLHHLVQLIENWL